jgi:transposase
MSLPAPVPLSHIGVGIDTARFGHRVSFLRPDRLPAAKPLTVTENQAGYQALHERLQRLQQQHPQAHFHVRIDAAGQYAANLEHFLRGLGLPMTLSIGEPKRNKDYQKAHFPKRTTDDTDSQAMARFAAVETPKATLPVPPALNLLREVAGRLQAQVKQSTQAINRLHNLLARVFPELAVLADDFAARWVLQLLDHYPSAERIAQARLTSLEKIPFLPADKAQLIHQAAQQSVGSLRGPVAETLVRDLVAQVRLAQRTEHTMRQLLTDTYADLPPSGHLHLGTIPGIGDATAAVLTAKIIDIDRFPTAESLVGFFGVFPEENRSGVDKFGKPLPPGTMHMSPKGNDLVRAYLWNAACAASRYNPAVRALHRRLKAKGKRGDVAIGHCMGKLLRLVFAVWKTNRPFDENHFAWDDPLQPRPAPTPAPEPAPSAEPVEAGAGPGVTPAPIPEPRPSAEPVVEAGPAAAPAPVPTPSAEPVVVPAPSAETPASAPTAANDKAVGHKREIPAQQVVTTATARVAPLPSTVNPQSPLPAPPARPRVDFAFLRQQITMEQVFRHLGRFDQLRGRGQQRRCPCPLHGQPTDREQTFSVHLGKGVFQCFKADCAAKGNVLDLWAALHGLPLYEAALHLADTFHLLRNREEEPVNCTRNASSPQTTANSAVITADGT